MLSEGSFDEYEDVKECRSRSRGRVVIMESTFTMVYGPPGVGKTTLASRLPNAIFLDVENSTRRMSVKKLDLDKVDDFASLLKLLLASDESLTNQTLVIDTLDYVESMIKNELLSKHKGKTLATVLGGYGAGYEYVGNEVQKLIMILDDLRVEHNVNIVLIAHSVAKTIDDIVNPSYQKILPSLTKHSLAYSANAVDSIIFLDREKLVSEKKVIATSRVLAHSYSPLANFEAKSRFGEMDPIDIRQANIDEFLLAFGFIEKVEKTSILTSLLELVDNLQEAEKREKAYAWIKENSSDVDALAKFKLRLKDTINKQKG